MLQNTSYTRVPPAARSLESVMLVEYAFQPIVSTTSLRAHGFEALARLPEAGPYADILQLLDGVSAQGDLRVAEGLLLTKAISKFATFAGASASRLFCNVDNRVFDDPLASPASVAEIATRLGLEPANICIELSERQPPKSMAALARLVDVFLDHNVRIAIDDFGQGFSGLDTLMRVNPHYVKIDRAFIDGLASSSRQQAIVSKMAGLSHSLGLIVVAEGVETEADFRMARDLGCDLAQGYLIARPSLSLADLALSYAGKVLSTAKQSALPTQIAELILTEPPLLLHARLEDAVERFKLGTASGFIPVVDKHGYVHGAVYQDDLRYFLFGKFGAALLANKGIDLKLERYVRRCPISEAGVATDAIVDSYVVAESNQGIILTLDGRYVGILSNHAILRLAAEREVAAARDQNPLTFLPGNNSISRHLSEILVSGGERTVVFFDFDNFKVFNDAYGFAVGDRALLLFSDLLMKFRHAHDAFVGHIGGDDFFLSIAADVGKSGALVRTLTAKFQVDVESLYLLEDRVNGGLWAKDRFGETRFFPMLRASAALLPMPAGRSHLSVAQIVGTLAEGKSAAKKSHDGITLVTLPATAVAQQLQRLTLADFRGGSASHRAA